MQNLITDDNNSDSPPDEAYLPPHIQARQTVRLLTGLPLAPQIESQDQDQAEDNQGEADNKQDKEDYKIQREVNKHKDDINKEETKIKQEKEELCQLIETLCKEKEEQEQYSNHKDKDKNKYKDKEAWHNPPSHSEFSIQEESQHEETNNDNKVLNQPQVTPSTNSGNNLNQTNVTTSTMVDPKYDIKRIDTNIIGLLKYSRSGHRKHDAIPLAIVQAFGTMGNVVWTDILLTQ